jgi:hypothetical protein
MTQGPVPTTGAPGATAGGGTPDRPPTYPSTTTSAASTGTREQAKEGAQHVAQEAAESGRRVAETAKGEAARTAEAAKATAADTAQEAKVQLQSLVSQTMSEFSEQAGTQQQRLASGLTALSGELESMARSSTEQGIATDVVRRAADYARRSGEWLEYRSPSDVLDDVKAYARRHPGAFLAIAAGLGVLTGRLARGAKDASSAGEPGGVTRTSVTTPGYATPSYTPLTGSSTASARTGATVPPPPVPPSGTTATGAGPATAPLSSPGSRPSDRPGGMLP